MNRTIKTLALAAVFCVIGILGLPQEVQRPAAPVAPVSAQAAQVQPVQAVPVQQVNPLAGLITMADAKRIALAAAGVAETDARNFKVELDSEGVLMLYEVEFDSGFHEYEYKIDARTGAIVGMKKKLDIF